MEANVETTDSFAVKAKGNERTKITHPVSTASDSEEYLEACARSNEKASRSDPLTVQFQAEKLPALCDEPKYIDSTGRSIPTSAALRARLAGLSSQDIEHLIYDATMSRLHQRCPGTFIAEAGNFAAVTCWEPRFAPNASVPDGHILNSVELAELSEATSMSNLASTDNLAAQKPLFASFLGAIEQAKHEHLYPILWRHASKAPKNCYANTTCRFLREVLAKNAGDCKKDPRLLYWKPSMTSRNPAVQPPVPGAVRAVLEPYVKRWVDVDKMPVVWLEAGSPRARDVYSWLGFRVVGDCSVGQDEQGQPIKTWFMIYTTA